jgi:DNA-cytosine methyltransferase
MNRRLNDIGAEGDSIKPSMTRTHVDLFSGIGGFSLAASWCGVETIAFAEIDSYASKILKRHWPEIRNYGDVRDVSAIPDVWLVTGGVPCQPASVAGKRRGAEDDRWLWPQALAAVERIRPAWVLFENPTGILSLNDGVEFERICAALEGQGYEVGPLVIPACGVGAKQRRDRVWIVAYIDNAGLAYGSYTALRDLSRQHGQASQEIGVRTNGNTGIITNGVFRNVAHHVIQQRNGGRDGTSWWEREPQETLRHAGRGSMGRRWGVNR